MPSLMKTALFSSICLLAAMGIGTGCAHTKIPSNACVMPDGTLDLFPGEDTIPIMSWHCILPEEISVEHFKELKECGINISFPHIYDLDKALKALDYAAEAGIRVMTLSEELIDDPATYVKRVMNHPGLAGYHLTDEPQLDVIPKIKKRNDIIRATDPYHYTYLNLLPIGGPNLVDNYEYYIRQCYDEVKCPFLSYDHYGIVDNVEIRNTYYLNMEIFSKIAREYGRPFWAFALSTEHFGYPIPDVAQLKMQMYSSLAYGAQGLQYFTYWKPDSDVYKTAPILKGGKRSSVYDFVKETNEELQKRNFVFMRSKVRVVRHTKAEQHIGTTQLDVAKDLPAIVTKLDTINEDAVVSLLEKGDKLYLVIVNAHPTKKNTLNISFADDSVMRIRKDGSIVPASEYSDTYIMMPGDCEVFSFSNTP